MKISQAPSFISLALIKDMDKNGNAISVIPSYVSSFIKYDGPPLLCRYPPPVVGRDDDIKMLYTIKNEVIIKSGLFIHSTLNKEKTLLAPDQKIANNSFSPMEEPRFHCLAEVNITQYFIRTSRYS